MIHFNDKLHKMSLEEKVGQLNQVFCGWNSYHMEEGKVVLEPEFEEALKAKMVGAVYGMHRSYAIEDGKRRGVSPAEGVRAINEIQRLALAYIGIPLIVSEECPKGYNAPGATVFPSPIAYGSSWNRELLRQIGQAAAKETKAGGGNVGYGPILDICHDPRWSRIEEIFGEDPFHSGELGVAMVQGMQGEGVISTLKHFAAYGTTEGGRNTAPTHMGERELREMHLPSFEAAVRAGAGSVMCSYNEIDGVPVSSDEHLLTEILRDEWGFDGFVVSDALAVDELAVGNNSNIKHRMASTLEEAGALAVKAGVDLSLWDKGYLYLADACRNGHVSEAVIDRAVTRILKAKERLGLFENPCTHEQTATEVMGSHADLSLEAARQSIILLKNNGILPLKKAPRLAVIGPNAHNMANMLGTYTPAVNEGVTVYDGLREMGEATYALGCRIKDPSREWFAEAIRVAGEADVVVAAVGGSSNQQKTVAVNAAGQIDLEALNRVSDVDCGENIDRDDLTLSGIQMELLQELKKTGKPLVVILIQGRPHDTRWIDEHADAVLCAWYPGPYGGKAVAEILHGVTCPSGKLTISFPKTVGQIPVNYNHKPTAEKDYLFMDTKPLYAFGHGLSYTTFGYDNLTVSQQGGEVDVTVDVSNTGHFFGTEIAQLYLRDEYASVTRPVKALRGFERVHLAPGETKTVKFHLGFDDMALWNRRMERVVEPGEFTVMVGGSSEDTLQASFTI